MNKIEIRKFIRAKRNQLSNAFQLDAAKQCAQIIVNQNIIQQNNNLAFYLSYNFELDLKFLLDYALNQGNKCYLPALSNQYLHFIEYNTTTELSPNKFNILEPVAIDQSNYINPQNLDIVFLPLVAFTLTGQRLGMGGGYYDRTFAFLNKSNNNINKGNPKLIGIAYDLQCIDYIPRDDWDIKLYGIATESKFIKF